VLETSVPKSKARVLLWWLPTLVWLVVLAYFSTDTFSADHTGSILWRLIHAVYGNISSETLRHINSAVRKSAHFFSYGFLSFVAFFAWRATFPNAKPWLLRWSGLALLMSLAAGSGDELHQTFVASRSASPHDVAIDVAGGVFFQLVIYLVIRKRSLRLETLDHASPGQRKASKPGFTRRDL
jgi:VanZ family protein